MEYSELLENACLCSDPVDRLKARIKTWKALNDEPISGFLLI